MGSDWYCSLVAWKGYYNVLGKDLDYNGGYWVLPEDIWYWYGVNDFTSSHGY